MGNVLRVLGIVLASMLLGLVGLFLLLFTICGGLKELRRRRRSWPSACC